MNQGTATVSRSLLSGNSTGSSLGDVYGGGAVYNLGGATLSVTDSTLSNNSAHVGGGIFNGGTLTVSGGTFSDNSAYYGGAIDNGGTATVSNSTVSGNTATYGGGVYNAGTLTVSGSILGPATISGITVPGNSASEGGGIDNAGTLTVENSSTITGNLAPSGYVADDVYNLGVLYWDLSSTITLLDGTGTVVRI